MILLHLHDDRGRAATSRRLEDAWTLFSVPLDRTADLDSSEFKHCLIEANLSSLRKVLRIQSLMATMERGGLRIFACPVGDPHAQTQARALGATHIVDRPFNPGSLSRVLAGANGIAAQPASAVVSAAALDKAFKSLAEGKPLSLRPMSKVAISITDEVAELGIESWLGSIRAHHAGTYQHCLIVTGLANAFGQAIRLSQPDIRKLTVAALLHDVGKARVDAAILDKNGPLTMDERAVIEMHPVWGEEYLKLQDGISPEVLNGVRHHHEMLDGSGYPDGLKGREIPDLTRLLTIVDIFGALVERRSYKAAMSGEAAYKIIGRMADAGKLEKALVTAFHPVAIQIKDDPVPHSA